MDWWSTMIAAALAGLALGMVVGLGIGRGNARGAARRARRLDSRLRTTVIPVLERRAESLGVPVSERGEQETDAAEITFAVASAIDRRETQQNLPFSDTVEINRSVTRTKR